MEMKRIRELSKDIAKKTLYTTAAVTIMGVGMYQFQSKVSRNLKTQEYNTQIKFTKKVVPWILLTGCGILLLDKNVLNEKKGPK